MLLDASSESISYQDKSKFLVFEEIFRRALYVKPNDIQQVIKIEKEISSQIEEVFGLEYVNVSLFDTSVLASCMFEPINTRHVLGFSVNRAIADQHDHSLDISDSEVMRALDQGEDGGIDLVNARATGVMGKLNADISISIPMLKTQGVTHIGSITAIFLHEIGHILTAIEYITETASFNANISNAILKATKGNTSMVDEVKVSLLYKLDTLPKDEQALVDDLNSSTGPILFSWNLSKLIYKHQQYALYKSYYDNTASEQQADSFAALCGYGAELAEVLRTLEHNEIALQEILRKPSANANIVRTAVTHANNILSITTSELIKANKLSSGFEIKASILGFILTIFSILNAQAIADFISRLLLSISATVDSALSFNSPEVMDKVLRYDDNMNRSRRLVVALSASLRDQPDMSDKQRQEIISSIDRILKVAEREPSKNDKIVRYALRVLLGNKAKTQIHLERQLEDLLANPLLIQSRRV